MAINITRLAACIGPIRTYAAKEIAKQERDTQQMIEAHLNRTHARRGGAGRRLPAIEKATVILSNALTTNGLLESFGKRAA